MVSFPALPKTTPVPRDDRSPGQWKQSAPVAGKPLPRQRERQAWTVPGVLCIALTVSSLRRCVWFLVAIAASSAGNADAGMASRPSQASGEVQVGEGTDSSALLPLLD